MHVVNSTLIKLAEPEERIEYLPVSAEQVDLEWLRMQAADTQDIMNDEQINNLDTIGAVIEKHGISIEMEELFDSSATSREESKIIKKNAYLLKAYLKLYFDRFGDLGTALIGVCKGIHYSDK